MMTISNASMLKMNENNNSLSLRRELDLAIKLAHQAAELILTIRAKGYQTYHKGQHLGLVTDADKAASRFLLDGIKRAFPDDIIISEEEPLPINTFSKRIWFIDPIDGTNDFIKGSIEWSIMIGLAIDGLPVLGVVYQPDSNDLYYATQHAGAFHINSQKTTKLKVNTVSQPSQAVLIQSRSHWSPNAQKLAETLGIKQTVKHGSLGLKLAKIAEGNADLYFNFSGHCHLWDLCGPEVILNEAGGQLLLATGKSPDYLYGETLVKDIFLATTLMLMDKIYPILEADF